MAVVHDESKVIIGLQARAQAWGQIGGPPRLRIPQQADFAYRLYLDFLECGALGLDFPRWLSRHSGYSYRACWKALKAGRARATGSGPNRNQAGLVAEIRERETTPTELPAWDDD